MLYGEPGCRPVIQQRLVRFWAGIVAGKLSFLLCICMLQDSSLNGYNYTGYNILNNYVVL